MIKVARGDSGFHLQYHNTRSGPRSHVAQECNGCHRSRSPYTTDRLIFNVGAFDGD